MRLRLLLLVAVTGLLVGSPTRLAGQGLRDKIGVLFIFGPGEDPLFLAGSADPDNPVSVQAHGTHFVPASAAENASVITFVTDAIGGSVANVPIGSTSGGETFRFTAGVPMATSISGGPIFAERAQTLGRGRLLVGLSRSAFHFETLRGVDLQDIPLVFTHENVDFPGCDSTFAGDCTSMGVPEHENDVMQFRLSLDIDMQVTSFYLTFGLSDRVDVGAILPIVSTSMRGESEAQMVPFGGPTADHFFAGTPTSPVLGETRTSQGSAIGLGDVALRLKANVRDAPRVSLALLADARFPTGSTDDLLGAGSFAARGLAVFTSRLGDVSPHANVGYLFRAASSQNDAVLATLGFDQRTVERVTLAVDVITEWQVGQSDLQLPPPVSYDEPFRRTVRTTGIPDRRDDILNGSFGFKVRPARGLMAVVNALFPLNRGGLRPGVVYTAALEYTL
jgi:hypothetical protein